MENYHHQQLYDQIQNHRFSQRTVPFDSHLTNASINRHNNNNTNHHLLNLHPPPPNPYQDSIDSLFSRLHVSDHSPNNGHQDLLFLSTNNHLFQPQEIPPRNSYLSPRLQDHVSNIDLLDNSLYGGRFNGGGGGFGNGGGLVSRSNNTTNNYVHHHNRIIPNYSPASSVVVDCLPLQYLRGKIVSFAKDQSGCRLVQRTVENLTNDEIDLVLFELVESLPDLMVDPFGNYVVQKLVEVSSEEQRTRILLSVTKKDFQLVTICLNTHGTRAVQKLLERIKSPKQVSIIMSALTPGVVALTKDMNGHHVIKYCLEHFSAQDNKYLLNVIADNCFDIARDKSGCCVLQQCVERSTGETRDCLVAEITTYALLLAEHQFGNYVVQHILGLKVPRITANLLRQLEGHFAVLACNKYGSNVVEKCLYESRGEQSTQIVLELLRSQKMSGLLVDPYGNFVIQAALSVSKGPILRTFLELIQANSPRMRNNIYGQKVLTWLQRKRAQYV